MTATTKPQRPTVGVLVHSVQTLLAAVGMAFLVKCSLYGWASYQHGVNTTVSRTQTILCVDRQLLVVHNPAMTRLMSGIEHWSTTLGQHTLARINRIIANLGITVSPRVNKQRQALNNAGLNMWRTVQLAWQSLWLKTGLLLSASVLYLSAISLGILDGLRARYVRTMEAGRESAYWFYHLRQGVAIIPAWLVFIYLITPFDAAINSVINGLAFTWFCLSAQVSAYFKKYV